jgi:hypothetical protein
MTTIDDDTTYKLTEADRPASCPAWCDRESQHDLATFEAGAAARFLRWARPAHQH